VAAEWMGAGPGAPTVLVYGHFDVQLVKGEAWSTEPHALVRKGDRLYGRGSADDAGGWLSHLVAIEAWLRETGGLPCNLKILLEGEEEIGSPNLERFIDAYPDAFASDAMVLTDCEKGVGIRSGARQGKGGTGMAVARGEGHGWPSDSCHKGRTKPSTRGAHASAGS